ncbi:MAG TPA: HisA/HisF-related TIM barrel protein [Longimicrobiales bacterium]|nr:HisA/HisF-related TIM barrel protein [Longimicrobiales bacterium]
MKPARILAALRIRQGRVLAPHAYGGEPDAIRLVDDFTAAGATEIAIIEMVQQGGSLEDSLALIRRLRRQHPHVRIAAGGGVGGLDDVGRLLQAGADRAIVGTAAIVNPELLRQAAQRFGRDTILASMEVRLERRRGEETVDVSGDRTLLLDTVTTGGWYRVYVRGGTTATSRDAISWASQCAEMGIDELMVTSIDPSGEASHFDLELIGRISESVPASVLAAGPAPATEMLVRLFTLAGGGGVVVLDAALGSPDVITRLRHAIEAAGVPVEGGMPTQQPRLG